jgi:hypothetical protein
LEKNENERIKIKDLIYKLKDISWPILLWNSYLNYIYL